MTIRSKMLLGAALVMTLVLAMGLGLYLGSRRSHQYQEWLLALQEQADGYNQLHEGLLEDFQVLLSVHQAGGNTRAVLEEALAHIAAHRGRLELSLAREREWAEAPPRLEEVAQVRALGEVAARWMTHAEARLRLLPRDAPLLSLQWPLIHDYERDVGRRLAALKRAARDKKEGMRGLWEERLREAELASWLIPVGSFGVLLGLALFIWVPLSRSLRALESGMERLGQGTFEPPIEAPGNDELGRLARFFNRMAGELRDSLREQQRLQRAEAEAAQREHRRYNALLEETVRARTTELQAANARLSTSLQELRSTQRQLQFAERMASVGRLAAGVGHEINNPLAYVLSNLSYVHGELQRTQGPPSAEERAEWLTALTEAREGADRVRNIVLDLKMLARADDTATGPVEVAAVVRSAAKMAGHELRSRARLVLACEGVPRVRANAARLCQVFLNLLVNAAHAIAPGREQENEVRVVARREGAGDVTVEVRDTGCGIAPENLERIFDAFFTTKPVGEGTGLGLAVCHGIISSFGGGIRVESVVGRGTSFFVTLPVALREELEDSSAHETAHLSA